MTVLMQNAAGHWVPSIPEPYFLNEGRRWRESKCRCNCGQVLRDRETYRGHYALHHILLEEPLAGASPLAGAQK